MLGYSTKDQWQCAYVCIYITYVLCALCVRPRLCVRVCACVSICVSVCACAYVCVCAYLRERACACVCAYVCVSGLVESCGGVGMGSRDMLMGLQSTSWVLLWMLATCGWVVGCLGAWW